MTDTPAKAATALRYWLQGREWHVALDAYECARDHHKGLRKDGETPEVAHPIAVALYVRTLHPHLLHPEESVAAALLHDVREDYDLGAVEIDARFGPLVAAAVDALTKTFRGVDRDPDAVFEAIAADPIASIVKAADRINNQHTLVGVFPTEKIERYIDETEARILPMLRIARRQWSAQGLAYENAHLVLDSQVKLLRAVVEA